MSDTDSIAAEFDRLSDHYTEDMVRCVPHYLTLVSCFVDRLPDGFAPDAVLDVGCGNGNVTARLLETFPAAHYTLLDASPEMLALCEKRFAGSHVTRVESYFQNYPFPSRQFDLITASFSLHHLDREGKQRLFPRLYDALKPGGLFTSSDLMMNKHHPRYAALSDDWRQFVDANHPGEDKWTWLMDHHRQYDHPEDFDQQHRWLLDAGFRNVTVGWRDGGWVHFLAAK